MTEYNCHCQKCGHAWFSRTPEKPKACPQCKRYDWSKATKEETL